MNTPTNEILERICDAHWNGKGEGIVFTDIYQHNSCNHTLSGNIDVDGIEYGFVIDNGDMDGTQVREWGLAEDVGTFKHPEPQKREDRVTFIPINHISKSNDAFEYKKYMITRETPAFIEKENAYHYDRHFQPGCFVENHYKKWAAEHGFRLGFLDELGQ